MKIRTVGKTVTFNNPFRLYGYKGVLPPGQYKVETEEQWLEGLSFVAFKRKQVTLQLQVDPKHPGTHETLILSDPKELDAALARDVTCDVKRDNIIGANSKTAGLLSPNEKKNLRPDVRRGKFKLGPSMTLPVYH